MPNPRIPRVIGILNILFGAALMLCGLGIGIYIAVIPMLARAVETQQKQTLARLEQQRAQAIEEISQQIEAAETEEEIAALEAQRAQVEQAMMVPLGLDLDYSQMMTQGFDDPKVQAYYWADLGTGIVLNVLMIVSGVGLIQLRPWGRTLALGVAALKIPRLVIVTLAFLIIVVPVLSKVGGEMVAQMIGQQQQVMGQAGPPAVPANEMIRVYGIMYSAYGVGLLVLGVIYPAIVLWALTRPGAKAACSDAKVETLRSDW